MSMTGRDFDVLAECLRLEIARHRDNESPAMAVAVENVADDIANTFARLYPRFNADWFRAACTPADEIDY